MAAYITQVERIRNQILANQGYNGVMTAITGGGLVVVQDKWYAALDATNLWTTAVGGTGTVARSADVSGRDTLLLDAPVAGDVCRINSQRAAYNPAGTAIATAAKRFTKLTMEWEAVLGTVANIDNATFMMGMTTEAAGARTTNNAVGFILASDVLTTMTDNGGTEQTTDVSTGITVTNINRFKIEVTEGLYAFFINGGLVAAHATQVPTPFRMVKFRVDAEAATGATSLSVGPVDFFLTPKL